MNKYAFNSNIQSSRSYTSTRSQAHIFSGWLAVMPLLVLIAFGVLYVIVVNKSASQGYKIHEFQNKIDSIRTENKKLEVQIAGLQSMQSVQARIAGENFIPVARVEYLPAVPAAVALK